MEVWWSLRQVSLHIKLSSSQVRNLLKGCEEFEQTEMVEMSERVRKLLGAYRGRRRSGTTGSGSMGLPEGIRAHHTTLQTRWEGFEKEVRRVTANMELALKFHEVLYEVSTGTCTYV